MTPRIIELGPTDFVTSDLHIGGAPFPYSMWGFKTPISWASKVAEVWDYQAGPQSTIVVVGDALEGDDGFGSTWIKSWFRERPGRKILVPGNHDACVDVSTRAVTKRGLVGVQDLSLEDEILTVDDNLNSVWVKPSRIIRKSSNEMVRVSSTYVDALLTQDHRVVYWQSDKTGKKFKKKVVEAARFTPNSKTCIVTAGAGSGLELSLKDRDIQLAAWCWTDSHRNKRGYWSFYQRASKVARIKNLLEGFRFSSRSRDRNIQEVDGRRLKQKPEVSWELDVLGGLNDWLSTLVPDRSRLSDWTWDLSERQVDLLVREWQYTDGTEPSHGDSVVLYCSKEDLRHDLMALMTANGYRVSETEYRPGHWRLNASKRIMTFQPQIQVQPEKWSGEVWCVTVPQGQFFVERGGKIHLTGNCHPHWKQKVEHLERQGWHDVFEIVEPNTALLEFPGGRQAAVCHFAHTASMWPEWKHTNRALPLVHGHNHSRQKVTLPSRSAQRRAAGQGQLAWGLTQIHVGWAAWRSLAPAQAVEELINEEAPVSR